MILLFIITVGHYLICIRISAQYYFSGIPLVRETKTERKFVRTNYESHFIARYAERKIDLKIHQEVVKAKRHFFT